jgi:Family of unknown function (DUF6282)
MRGAVLKDHLRSTVADAYLVSRHGPAGSRFSPFASLCLNATAGGLSALAAESAIGMGARAVFLPTHHAANNHAVMRSASPGRAASQELSVLDSAGQLNDAARAVLAVCAQAGVLLCTGHLSADEIEAVLPAASELGLRVLVTHAPSFTGNDPGRLARWAAAGAALELVAIMSCGSGEVPDFLQRTPADDAALIEYVGSQHIVLASDLGQVGNRPPWLGLQDFAEGLRRQGISSDDLHTMTALNPARLLGLDT